MADEAVALDESGVQGYLNRCGRICFSQVPHSLLTDESLVKKLLIYARIVGSMSSCLAMVNYLVSLEPDTIVMLTVTEAF